MHDILCYQTNLKLRKYAKLQQKKFLNKEL
jgi:hypothetical protein